MQIKHVPQKKVSLDDLFQEEQISSWRDFVGALMKCPHDNTKLWRGQSNAAWKLVSSYRRAFDKRMAQQTERKPFDGLGYALPIDYENLCRNTFAATDESDYHLSRPLNFAWNISSGDDRRFYGFLKKYENDESKRIINKSCDYGCPFDYSTGFAMDLRHWAWGQHYGVKTPLLDWTIRPLLALYFACSNYQGDNEDIAVFSLSTDLLNQLNSQTLPVLDDLPQNIEQRHIDSFLDEAESFFGYFIFSKRYLAPKIKLNRSLSFFLYYDIIRDAMKLKLIPPYSESNKRQLTQEGVLSFSPCLMPIEEWCKNYIATFTTPMAITGAPLIKKYCIAFSYAEKKNCLAFLDSANINAKTVYPDFYGISRYMEELTERRM